MSRQITSSVLAGVTIGILLGCSTPVLAGMQQAIAERYSNDCRTCENGTNHDKECLTNDDCPGGTCEDRAAKCLVKYVYGIVFRAKSDKFANCDLQPMDPYTRISCYTGEVAFGATATADILGIAVVGEQKPGPLCAKWYADTACTDFIGYAERAPRIELNMDGNVNVVVEHGAREWNDATNEPGDPLGTIYGRDVQYAVTDYFRPLEDLNDDLFTDGSITWHQLDPFTLENFGDDNAPGYDLGALAQSDIVLFRFYTGPAESETDNYELVQFCLSETCIPAVSQWGILVIALLLAAGGTIVIRRRRAMPA